MLKELGRGSPIFPSCGWGSWTREHAGSAAYARSPGVSRERWWSQQPSVMLDGASQLKQVDLIEVHPWRMLQGMLWTCVLLSPHHCQQKQHGLKAALAFFL